MYSFCSASIAGRAIVVERRKEMIMMGIVLENISSFLFLWVRRLDDKLLLLLRQSLLR